MILVDSSVWIDYFWGAPHRKTNRLDDLLEDEPLATGDLVLTEVLRKLRALGITVRKTVDTIIATRCIEDDFALLYSDRDFDPFVKHLGLRSAMSE